MTDVSAELRGRTAPWGRAASLVLGALVLAGLWLRLFGRTAGLLSAGLAAFSVTLIGYQRVAKEDTLLGLFLMLLLWCMAEAYAAPGERKWELGAAASLAGMLASKYFFFLTPIPVVFYLWVRRDSAWRVPLKRWLQLIGVALVLWPFVNWSPFLSSTW